MVTVSGQITRLLILGQERVTMRVRNIEALEVKGGREERAVVRRKGLLEGVLLGEGL
jgi:hypothetical protein